MSEWRWTDDRGVQRLVGTDELRAALASNVLPSSTLVWSEGMSEWAPASTIPELVSASPNAAEDARTPVPMDASRAGRLMAAPPAPQRASIPTLVGLPMPESQRHGAPLSVPIVVPSPGGTPEPGRAVITQIPRYGATPGEESPSAPDIPKAPRLPASSGLKERPKTQRKVTTSEIDGLWAAPSTDLDNAAAASALDPSGKPGAPVTAKAAEGAALDSAGGAVEAGPDKATSTSRENGSSDASRAAAATASSTVEATRPLQQSSATPKAAASDTLAKQGSSPAMQAPGRRDSALPPPPAPGRRDSALPPLPAPARRDSALPPAPAPARRDSALPPAPAPLKPARSDAKPPESPANRPKTTRPPPPPPPRPLNKPPSKLPPPLHANTSSSSSPDSDVSAAFKPDPLPPPPPLFDELQAPKPLSHEEAADINFITALPAEEGFASAVTASETPKPTAPIAAASSQESASPLTPVPPETSPRTDAKSSASMSPDRSMGSSSRALPPRRAEALSSPSEREMLPSRPARISDASADEAIAHNNTHEPPKPLDQPVSVPVSSLFGAGGALILMVISAFFVGRCSAKSPPIVARAAFQAVPAVARSLVPVPPKPCWVVRQPVMWAPKVSNRIPFDVVATAQGSLSVGYARDTNEALGIEVSPVTGQVVPRYAERFTGDILRVMPMPDAQFLAITKENGGALSSAIPVPATPPFFLGQRGSAIATTERLDSALTELWPLSGDEGLSAARVQIAGDRGYGLIFRREGVIFSGWIGADHKPAGELSKVIGSGGSVGKPNSGWNRREFAVIFADRPEGSERWEIRIGHAPTGQVPTTTTVIPLPKGGPGGDAFAPDIAGMPDGRWLLIWTEGSSGSRAIRAQTFTHDFVPLGDPIALSPPAGNFGQGVLGVVDNYAGAIFLSKGASSYELWGSILRCG